jgi:hypothetical protein
MIAEGNIDVSVALRLYYGSRWFLFPEFSCRYYYSTTEDVVLSTEKYYSEYEDNRRQNMWIENPFGEHKETAFSHELTELS